MKDQNIYSPFNVDIEAFLANKEKWEEYTKKTASLSAPIKDILFLSETTVFVSDISVNFNLSDEQTANLSRAIRDILIGDIFIGDMARNIADKFNILPEKAKEITNRIISKLFAPAIEDIKKMQREKFKDRLNKPAPRPANPQNINQNNVINLRDKPQ